MAKHGLEAYDVHIGNRIRLSVTPAYFFEGLPVRGAEENPDAIAVERMVVSTGGADVARAFLKLSKRSRIALRMIAEALASAESVDEQPAPAPPRPTDHTLSGLCRQ